MKLKEEWKDIEGYDGFYQISNYGRVRTFYGRNGREQNVEHFRRASLTHDGYLKIRLIHGGKDKTTRIHRLVAEAFLPNPDNKDTVNHIDGDKTNNVVTNLEWIDRSEQMYHAYSLGLKKSRTGSLNSNAKLSDNDVRYIRKVYVRYSKEFGTVALAEKFNVTNRVIGLIVNNKAYKNVK